MKKTYRKHSPAFKTKVVLEALKERETLSELAQRQALHHADSRQRRSSWRAPSRCSVMAQWWTPRPRAGEGAAAPEDR
ncbi:MAG: hypothetical protein IPM68_01495 [Flavobacteriales bacterium]|nr:hypothetical protein [Flavobacteriales bacterium]